MKLPEMIRSRGHWKVVVRPTRFEVTKIENITALFPLVQRLAVQIRGWDFPHIDQQHRPTIGEDWAGQSTHWQHHLEKWRLYQSGQFAFLGGVALDWAKESTAWGSATPTPDPGALLGVHDVVCRYTEIFEFAARLGLSEAGAEEMKVEIGIHKLSGRQLHIESPGGYLSCEYRASVDQFETKEIYASETLANAARDLALSSARELFRRFGWDSSQVVLQQIQSQFGSSPH